MEENVFNIDEKLNSICEKYNIPNGNRHGFISEIKEIVDKRGNLGIGKKLKPFDINEAKAGKPMCTREGRKARIICTDLKSDSYPLVAAITQSDGTENVFRYTKNGNFLCDEKEDRFDLIMLPEKHKGWVNIYKGGLLDVKCYHTKKEAFNKASPNDYIDTIKIEWEE